MLSLIVAGTFTILLGLDVLLKQHVEETISPGKKKNCREEKWSYARCITRDSC